MHRFIASSLRRHVAVVALFSLALCAAASAIEIVVAPETWGSAFPFQYAPGTTVTFSTSGTLDPGATLQWLHNDEPIPGATQSTLRLLSVTAADTGNYQLRTKLGATTETTRSITINVLPLPPSPVDSSFQPELPTGITSANVEAFGADDSMIVQASVSSDPRFLRLLPDGSADPDFALQQTAKQVLAVLPDGGLIVAAPPYRTTPEGKSNPIVLPATFDATKDLTAARVQSDGKVLLAQNKQICRLNTDGTVDASFAYNANASAPGSIDRFRVDSSGRIYVRGWQANPVPTNYPQSWRVVFRLGSNGQRDTGFKVQEPILLTGSLIVEPLADGRIFYYSRYHGYVSWHLVGDDGRIDTGWKESTVFSDTEPVIDALNSVAYLFDTSGVLRRYQIGPFGLVADTTFYAGSSSLGNSQISVDRQGRIVIAGWAFGADTAQASPIVRLLPNVRVVLPPKVAAWAHYTSLASGSSVALVSDVFGTGPFTYEWLALDGQTLPAEHFSPELNLAPFRMEKLGRYQLKVIGPGGGVLSQVVTLAADPKLLPYLANLSGRARTGKGEDTVIAGLAVREVRPGSANLHALIRGVGPGLKSLGVGDAIVNPALDVFDTGGTLVANNDQWSVNPDTADVGARVGAFPLAAGSFDAALVGTFARGTSTMMLKDQGQGDGVGLLEIYHAESADYPLELVNLSFRARTAPGDAVAIAGFVVVDPLGYDRPARLLVRAVGPTLSAQGISHPLENPVLKVFKRNGDLAASNDDWAVNNTSGDRATLAAAMKQVGAFELPAESKDAALLLDLPAGAYSIHANGGTGVVLLEIYLVR